MTTEASEPSGPWVQFACFCQDVGDEPDGTFTIRGQMDRTIVTVRAPQPPTKMPAVERQLKAIVSLVPGRARGRVTVTLDVEEPDGYVRRAGDQPLLFESEDRGTKIIFELDMTFELEGLYWFSVRCDGRLLTRMPFRMVYAPYSTAQPQGRAGV